MKYIKEVVCKKEDWKIEREKELDQAAYRLSDEIWPIVDKLNKALTITGEMRDEYFNKYSRDKQEDAIYIRHDFYRNSILMDIVSDYIWEAFKEARDLEERGNMVGRARLEEQGENGNE